MREVNLHIHPVTCTHPEVVLVHSLVLVLSADVLFVEERPSPFSFKDQSLFVEPTVMGGRLVRRLDVKGAPDSNIYYMLPLLLIALRKHRHLHRLY